MKEVRIRGHQRAGNHYLAALIELNLFDSMDSERHHDQRGHLLPHECADELNNEQILNIFIHRKFETTLDSIYRMRHRFRLSGDPDKFKVCKIGQLFDSNVKECEVEVNWYFKEKEIKTQVSSYFGLFPDMTLHEWWMYFISSWLQESWRKNVYMCRYEYLLRVDGRRAILRDISRLLRRPISGPIKNISDRVGYFDKGDETWSRKLNGETQS